MGRLRFKDNTRALQLGFLALMLVCTGQVAWWYFDQVAYTDQVRMMMLSAYQVDLIAAHELIEEGMPSERIQALFPHLDMDAEGQPTIHAATMDGLDRTRARRLRRYWWEAGFFAAVLIGGIGVLWRALRAHEELQRRQQNFLAAVSHEFKSPLASLRLSVESLGRRAVTPERQAILLGRIGEDLDRFEGMVTNILATSRLEDGEWRLYPEPISLESAVHRTISELTGRAEAKGVKLRAEVKGDVSILADATAFHSVMGNLVGNAIRAAARDQGQGEVAVYAWVDGGEARIEVADDGVGFPDGEATRLFEKFYRPGDEMRRQGGGTGLGLYIVRTLVELSGGDVRAHSDGPGQGARFTVRWPLARRADAGPQPGPEEGR